MKRGIFHVLSLLGIAFVAAPAGAVNVPGCGEFLIFAEKTILFEQGATELTGNIFSQTGKITIGAHNRIHGTVSAPTIVLGTGAVVDHCQANSVTGPGTCGDVVPFAPAAACLASFPPAPITVPAFPGVCAPNTVVSVPAGTTQSLAPGCYRSIRVNQGATLELQAGANYFTSGETRVLAGGTLQSDTTGSPVNLTVKGIFITEAGVSLNDLNVFDLAGPGNNVHIVNGSIVNNTLVVSSVGEIHIHTGSSLRGTSELVAVTLQVEPITNQTPQPELCVCQGGTVFEIEPTPPFSSPVELARRCVIP